MKNFSSIKNIKISKAPPILLCAITVGASMDTGKDSSEGKTTKADNFTSIAISIMLFALTIYFWLKKNDNFD